MNALAPVFTPPVIAHRGTRSTAPENTAAAFKNVRATGARWLETDVKLTRDGVPILFHDETLNRTTNGKGLIAEMDWAQLQTLDAGSWFGAGFAQERIPRLSDVLHIAFTQQLRVNIELKPCPGRTLATAMVTMIEIAKLWSDVYPPPLISSFDIDALMISSRMHPEWPRGLLLDDWQDDWLELAERTAAATIHFNERVLTETHLDILRQSQRPILAYTVNDPLRAKQLIAGGVRAVFSDDPATIIAALAA